MRKVAAVILSALALLGFTASLVHDNSKGPSNTTARVQTTDLGRASIELVATTCDSLDYPDGAAMFAYCYEYASSSYPDKWSSGWRHVENIAYPSGHTDTMRYCIYGFQHCTAYVNDGGVASDGFSYLVNNNDTMWVEVDVKYGLVWYCRRAFGSRTGSIAFTTCPS